MAAPGCPVEGLTRGDGRIVAGRPRRLHPGVHRGGDHLPGQAELGREVHVAGCPCPGSVTAFSRRGRRRRPSARTAAAAASARDGRGGLFGRPPAVLALDVRQQPGQVGADTGPGLNSTEPARDRLATPDR